MVISRHIPIFTLECRTVYLDCILEDGRYISDGPGSNSNSPSVVRVVIHSNFKFGH